MTTESSAALCKPEAILFDWDNTLIESWAIIHDAMNYTQKIFDKPLWTLAETKALVRKSMRNSFPELFGDEWERAADIFYQRFDDIHISLLDPMEGAGEMLKDMSDRGIYMAVVSNKRGHYLRKEADHLGWSQYFSRLVGALDAEKDKPALEPVEMALEACPHKSGEKIWFVGDADIDMECAVNAGIAPVLLRQEAPKEGEFASFSPIYHVGSCHALSKMLGNM